ncbi:MAG: DUF29 domain-containing protein [Limnothrix sp. RL_2_0]|nr:DUF29 domain-containing protein [Limnothrix sp. RL_2_0]
MISKVPEKAIQLYDADYFQWIEETLTKLKASQFSEVDWENLIEEIEDMGRSEKRAIYNNLKILLLHLLKYRYQKEKRSKSWRSSIREHRQRLYRAFKESPSLTRYFESIIDESYEDARGLASDETGLDIDKFPKECPFSTEEILDMDFLGEQ